MRPARPSEEPILTTSTVTDTRRWAVEAARAADAKQAREPVVMDVGEVLAICEWFVVASGANDRQVKAIADEIEKRVFETCGVKPARVDGLGDLQWVLIDYGDLVVHLFSEEARSFYELERLWADVPRVDWRDQARGADPG